MPGSTTTAATTASNDGTEASPSTIVTWDAVKEFSSQYQPRKDAACISLDQGKVLVTGGISRTSEDITTSSSCQLLEWNVRRAWKFPSLQTARLGHAAVHVDGTLVVLGGADEETNVLASVEECFLFAKGTKKEWKLTAQPMACPRMYATALGVPTSGKSAILVLGGRDDGWQELDSMEIGMYDETDNSLTWTILPQTLPTPRFGSAAVLIDNQKLFVMGGYDGRQWQTDCYMCDIHSSSSSSSSSEESSSAFTTGSWNDMPPLLEAVRFGTAAIYYQHVLLLGQTEQGTSCLQCFDCNQRTWIWKKMIQVPMMEGGCLALQEPYVYGLAADGSSSSNSSSVFSCEMRKIDKKLYDDSMAVAVGAVAAADDEELIDTPTIIAMDPVAVVEDENSSSNANSNKHSRDVSDMNMSQSSTFSMDLPNDRGVTLRAVTRIMLPSEKSFYTGQLRKKDGSWVPHGEGLEVWVDTKDGQTHPGNNQEVKNSYYKGRFVDGYRHGLGEMYLRIEEKHYFGQFKYGSWDGIGTLKMKNRGFSYFGQFISGEMTGLGRCSFRVRKGSQWVQKTYAGAFLKGKANGLGAVSSFATGKVDEYREFNNEDLFDMGTHGSQASPADDAIDC